MVKNKMLFKSKSLPNVGRSGSTSGTTQTTKLKGQIAFGCTGSGVLLKIALLLYRIAPGIRKVSKRKDRAWWGVNIAFPLVYRCTHTGIQKSEEPWGEVFDRPPLCIYKANGERQMENEGWGAKAIYGGRARVVTAVTDHPVRDLCRLTGAWAQDCHGPEQMRGCSL